MFVEMDAKGPLENSHVVTTDGIKVFATFSLHISPPVTSALVNLHSIPLSPNSTSPFFSLFDAFPRKPTENRSQNPVWVVIPEGFYSVFFGPSRGLVYLDIHKYDW